MIRFRPDRSGTDRPATALRRRDRSRGQSLVEFALVIPILLFLTLIALDFGRVYLGYINLQNMARIAANFAGNNPSAWDGVAAPNDATLKTKFYNQIIADAAAINCTLIDTDGDGTLDADDFAPTFKDATGNGLISDVGDTGEVQIGCRFGVITPGIANVVGSTVNVAAKSTFPVKAGMVSTGPGAGGGSAPNAAFSGNGVITSVSAPASISGVAPFDVEFRDTSGGNPTSWLWTFPDAGPPHGASTTLQDPLIHTFTAPGTYIVSMVATNLLGSSTASMGVTVVATSDVNFEADQTNIPPGTTVTFTDLSVAGGTAWDWSFGAGEGSSAVQNPTHTYNTAGTFTVSLTVTYPSPTGPLTETKTGYIKVEAGLCLVPSLDGVRFNDAEAIWQGPPNNFTGVVIRAPGAPNGNFIINGQDRTANSWDACDVDVTVNQP
jgi:PKD repeat protein